MTQGCALYTVYFVNCKARRALGPSVWTLPKFPPLFLSPVRSARQKLLFPVYKWGSQDRPTTTHWRGVEPAPRLHLLSRPALHLAPVVASLFSQRLRKGALESDRLGLEFWSCTGCEIDQCFPLLCPLISSTDKRLRGPALPFTFVYCCPTLEFMNGGDKCRQSTEMGVKGDRF